MKQQRMSRIYRRLFADRRGFSLLEMMVAMIIVGLISIMLVVGTQLALKAYSTVVDEANAEVLLSTGVTMLRTELSTASNIEVSADKKSLTYRKSNGYIGEIGSKAYSADVTAVTGENSRLCVSEYGDERPFIGDITATNGLLLDYESVDYTDGIITVEGLKVTKPGSTDPLASLPTLVISGR